MIDLSLNKLEWNNLIRKVFIKLEKIVDDVEYFEYLELVIFKHVSLNACYWKVI